MIEICPLCGRYSLSLEYPPKPCPICEEELLNKPLTPPPLPLTRPSLHREAAERRPEA